MPKIKIKVTISNNITNSYEVMAIKTDNTIKYQEPDKTKIAYEYDNQKLIRENEEIKLEMYFKESRGVILYKPINMELDLDIKTINITRNNNDIEIEYQVVNSEEQQNFIYRIEELK